MKKIALLIVAAFLSSCGTVDPITNDLQDEQQTNPSTNNNNQAKDEPKSCDTGFYGPECKPCTCQNGSCNDGINGDGSCSCDGNWSGDSCDQCTGNFWGSDCNKAPTCQHGAPSLGVNGNGHCTSCEAGYYGLDCREQHTCINGTASEGSNGTGNCSSCYDGYYGANCENAVKCLNGTPKAGINGDGHCSNCTSGWAGEDCNIAVTCQHGNASTGITGNGKCSGSCQGNWVGENCDRCDDDHYGANCDKVYGSVTDVDGNTYKTVVVGSQTWMAENLRVTRDRSKNTLCPQGLGSNFCGYEIDEDGDYLYQWNYIFTTNGEHMDIACPSGWKVPKYQEIKILKEYLEENGLFFETELKFKKKSLYNDTQYNTIWVSSYSYGATGARFAILLLNEDKTLKQTDTFVTTDTHLPVRCIQKEE